MPPKQGAPAKPKSKTQAPTPVAPAKPSIEDLYSSLDRCVQTNDYRQIVKISDQILADAPEELNALLCKVVALIQDDKVDDALSTLNSSATSDNSLNFHKAYCLYKKNHLQEAILALEGLEKNEGVLQLEAQILYRQGEFNACIASYQALSQKFGMDSTELKTNLIASYISGGKSDEVSSLMESLKVTPRSSFELAYNAACALIEGKNYIKAEELLLLSRRLGQEALVEEEYTKDEIEDELAPISVQLAFVQQAQDRSVEALEAYNKLLKQKLGDAPSMAVACNNVVVLRGNKELADSIRKLDNLFEKKTSPEQGLLFVDTLEHKLSTRQKEAISFNRLLVLLLGNKLDQVRELLPSLFDKFPESVMPPLLSASLLLREGKLTRAEEMLGQYLEKHPNDLAMLLLARAQVAALAGHHVIASKSLEQIQELQHKPAVVATLVALKEKGGDVNGAEATLDTAVQWWEDHMGEDNSTLELIAQEAATFKLRHKKEEAASALFLKLVKSSSEVVRAEALTGLVSSTAHTDIVKAEEYERQLPPLRGVNEIDVSALEETGSTVAVSVGAKRPWMAAGDGASDGKSRHKKRRKRRPRYPKGFDPANPGPPPDPERWLPLKERSTYRPKRKDRRGPLRGSQGSVARTAPTGSTTNGPSTSAAAKAAAASSSKAAETSKASTSSTNKSKKKSRR
ncbi:hypothetical protein GOP47_0027248 [Adiantum capillus-veneris]|nr:hypothetical protein GOP47_0027248 [Adiantum capillus-veneris]